MMALAAGHFQTIANNAMSDTFAAFKKTLVLRTADAVVLGTAQTYTSETGTGIELSIDNSLFSGDLIQVGDKYLFTNASQWTADPEAGGTDITFDGIAYQIILVEKDADSAAYFLTVRKK
jgi:hypothetical protein